METAHEITHKEIRGITTRTISWILGFIIPIAIAGGVAYANIMNSLNNNQKNGVVTQLQIDILKADLKATQNRLTDQEIRLTRIEVQIKDKIFMTDAPPNYKLTK